jgi:hypothetical protein
MRSHPGSFQLTFLLPGGAAAVPGFHQPSPEGCALAVAWPLVTISGPSRRAVFDHATRLLRLSCQHLPATSIAARLVTPGRPAGSDAWSIAVNADVSFSPTGIDPEFPGPEREHPPPRRLAVVDGGRSA